MQPNVPIPHDIPLPLPFDRVVLQAIIVVVFLAHIVFINFTVGGSLFAVIFEIIGLRRPDYDRLAHELSKTITVNKSLAVVLGVGPLLAINVLYTIYFYSANALTGYAWISIVPLVSLAFLIMYVHKYSWDRLSRAKGLHIAIGAMGALLFLAVPFIFLTNINLMLFPARWTQVHGFRSALTLPNVFPRYLHFLLACIAVNGVFMLGWFTRKSFPVETTFEHLTRPQLRKLFYAIACGSSALQLFAGPLLLITLPHQGYSVALFVVIFSGATLAITMIGLMWWEIISPPVRVGRFFVPVIALLMFTGSLMGFGRHLYREQAIYDHRELMARKTQDLAYAAAAAQWRAEHGVVQEKLPLGERVFRDSCSSCHALDHVLVGPPIREIAQIYKGNPAGIVAWAKAPGKKRAGFPAMPALNFTNKQFQAVAEYMLAMAAAPAAPASQSATQPTTTQAP